jgi:hypothetical protein
MFFPQDTQASVTVISHKLETLGADYAEKKRELLEADQTIRDGKEQLRRAVIQIKEVRGVVVARLLLQLPWSSWFRLVLLVSGLRRSLFVAVPPSLRPSLLHGCCNRTLAAPLSPVQRTGNIQPD